MTKSTAKGAIVENSQLVRMCPRQIGRRERTEVEHDGTSDGRADGLGGLDLSSLDKGCQNGTWESLSMRRERRRRV